VPTNLSFKNTPKPQRNLLAQHLAQNLPAPGQLHQPTFAHYANKLISAISLGAQLDATTLDVANPLYPLLNNLRNNALQFAAAKTLTLLQELGTNPTEAQIKAALNRHSSYFEAEYNLATASTQMAIKWQDIQSQSTEYSKLRYITVKDARVRDAHRVLHGVTLPITDPFWATYYPPNGYNCRCIVQQVLGTAPDVTPTAYPTEKEMPAALKFNPGIDQVLFSDKHPYFKQAIDSSLLEDATIYIKAYDLIYKSKGQVTEHIIKRAPDQADNVQLAKQHADIGYNIDLLPYSKVEGVKNPECRINGMIADFKESNGSSRSLQDHISDANDKKCIPLITLLDYNKRDVVRSLCGSFAVGNKKQYVSEVWLLIPNTNDYIKIKRALIIDRSFIQDLP
jgi:SPP1 gp7 family putative phage head morphogenesis protein